MNERGSRFYDDAENFHQYLERRDWNENANDTIEKPAIMELLGPVNGLRILDLGCGSAAFGNELLDLGGVSYTGIDGSANMVEMAKKTLSRANGEVIHSDLEEWNFPESSYSLIVSRLVLHYVSDLDEMFSKVYRSLQEGGTFVFSVEHPVFSALQNAGFQVESLREGKPLEHHFHNVSTYERRMRIPLFLLLKASKSATPVR